MDIAKNGSCSLGDLEFLKYRCEEREKMFHGLSKQSQTQRHLFHFFEIIFYIRWRTRDVKDEGARQTHRLTDSVLFA